jgi:glycogen operon protein
MSISVHPGQSYPLGATVYQDGVNFSIFSHNATSIELLLFDDVEDSEPAYVITLDEKHHQKTFYYWHVFVKGIGAGQLYGYRVYGPFAPERGLRFDGSKVLIDPYARAVMYGKNYDREAAIRPGDNSAHAMKSVVVDPLAYDWEGDMPLELPFSDTVIYEMHVGGFTRHPNSGLPEQKRGTYAGLIEKIPYLKELGITAVELMPVQQFDTQDAPPGLTNYWGYSPIAFFAPHREYSSCRDPLGPVKEFRDMVKALHRAGIEVILDVVFNHTAEGHDEGPTFCFKGLENRAYYILNQHNQSQYLNYSGTGNTINGNHSVVRRMIMDCLRYWVQEMHVDGFRFDLASILSRGEDGHPLTNPPVLWSIDTDPVLAGAKMIAEAWDAAGLYQVGSFIGNRWAEWNGKYRDDVRQFVRGDNGMIENLSDYISGSRHIYNQPGHDPNRSINFITAHDGFTLNDLVSYNEKHNSANKEDNRDGANANYSWNHGVEGPTNDTLIDTVRMRQIKNFLTILFVSQGKPMLLMGDEIRRSQYGNNNAYCQDNEMNWLNWENTHDHTDLLRFTQGLIKFHQNYHVFHQQKFWVEPGGPELIWHGVKLHQPDWGHYSHSLAFELYHPAYHEHLYIILNAYWKSLDFELPAIPHEKHWFRVVDTGLPSPEDFVEPGNVRLHIPNRYTTHPRSAVILVALPADGNG